MSRRTVAAIIADLHTRDLLELATRVALSRRVPLEDALSTSKHPDIVQARHAVWRALVRELGNVSAVSRIVGVDHTSVLYAMRAEDDPPIQRVLLDTFASSSGHRIVFVWMSGRSSPFGVSNCKESTTWFEHYKFARAVFVKCCEEASGEAHTFATKAAQATIGGAL